MTQAINSAGRFAALLTIGGLGKTAVTGVTCRVWKPDGTEVAPAPTVTELGGGLYVANVASLNLAGHWYAIFRAPTGQGVDTRDVPCMIAVEPWAANIDAPITGIAATVWAFATRTLTAIGNSAGMDTLLALITPARAAKIDNADVASSTLATASGVASQIATRATPSDVVAALAATLVRIDLTQAIPTSNTAQTLGDALNGARSNAFGKWVLSGTTLTMYAPDGATVVRTFALDSASAPTSRT